MPITTPTVAPTVQEFLADYPKFDTGEVSDAGAVQFGPDAVSYWLNMAVLSLNRDRWGSWYYPACELFMAHSLALEAWAEQGSPQSVPGLAKGSIAGTSAGGVAVSYNNAATAEFDGGHWNYTIFGQRFLRMARMVGMGPLQVTGGCSAGPFNGPAWAGPWPYNFPNPA